MQRAAQALGPAEEHAGLRGRVQLADAAEDHVPVRAAEVRGTPQARDSVLVGVGVVDHDVRRVVGLDLGRQVRVDLDAPVDVLRLDGHEQRPEPLERAEVAADPEEVHLGQPRLLLRVVHPVPDGFEDARKGRNADTGTAEDRDLVLEDVFRCGPEGPVDVYARQHAAERGVDLGVLIVDAYDLGGVFAAPILLAKLAAQRRGDLAREIAYHAHVDRDVVLLGGAR